MQLLNRLFEKILNNFMLLRLLGQEIKRFKIMLEEHSITQGVSDILTFVKNKNYTSITIHKLPF